MLSISQNCVKAIGLYEVCDSSGCPAHWRIPSPVSGTKKGWPFLKGQPDWFKTNCLRSTGARHSLRGHLNGNPWWQSMAVAGLWVPPKVVLLGGIRTHAAKIQCGYKLNVAVDG